MRLIDADELLKAVDTWDKFGVDDTNSLFRLDNLSLPHYVPYIHYDDVIKCIKGMPTVQAVPLSVLQEIRQEIESNMETITGTYDASTPEYNMPSHKIERNFGRKECIAIIGKHIKEIENIGDYPDEIPNQFDNLTGSMNV